MTTNLTDGSVGLSVLNATLLSRTIAKQMEATNTWAENEGCFSAMTSLLVEAALKVPCKLTGLRCLDQLGCVCLRLRLSRTSCCEPKPIQPQTAPAAAERCDDVELQDECELS